MSECNCDMRTKLVGDGCQYCNPQYVIEHLTDERDELEKEIEQLQQQNAELVKRAYLEGWDIGWVSRNVDTRNDERVFSDLPPKGEAESDWQNSEAREALTPKQVADR